MKSITIILLLVLAYCGLSEAVSGQRCRLNCNGTSASVCGELSRPQGRTALCTFRSKCVLERTKCLNNQDWKIYLTHACRRISPDCQQLKRTPK